MSLEKFRGAEGQDVSMCSEMCTWILRKPGGQCALGYLIGTAGSHFSLLPAIKRNGSFDRGTLTSLIPKKFWLLCNCWDLGNGSLLWN